MKTTVLSQLNRWMSFLRNLSLRESREQRRQASCGESSLFKVWIPHQLRNDSLLFYLRQSATLAILIIAALTVLAGCQPGDKVKEQLSRDKELLTIDWQYGRSLEYKFVSGREIIVDWDPEGKASKTGKHAPDKSFESMEMVVSYTPIEIDPYGLTTIEAACKSVKVARSKRQPKDAVEYLAGKKFTFTVTPTGKIEDYSQLDELLKEAGKKAFITNADGGRIKEADMICDFVATQWFLWDSVSSLKNPSKGVVPGQSWKSKLSVPAPMVMRKARDVTYRLEEIRQSEMGRLALIRSSYQRAETVPQSWPIPYSGSFQMKGTFGFLSGCKLLSLEGGGEELFNIEKGRIEQYNQQYQMQLQASIPMGINVKPMITIKQNLTMELK